MKYPPVCGDLVTHLDGRGCPTTAPSLVMVTREKTAYVIDQSGAGKWLPIAWMEPWIAPPAGWKPPRTKRLDGGRPFNNKFGFLRI